MNTQGRKFSPERLLRIRRLRKARRLFKQSSLFAYQIMRQEYPEYTYEEFWDDLRRRTKKKRKKHKTPLARYRRYMRMEQLMARYLTTKDPALLWQANQLRRRITKPYRLLVRVNGTATEYYFSPLTPIEQVEQLNEQVRLCKTQQEAETITGQFRATQHLR